MKQNLVIGPFLEPLEGSSLISSRKGEQVVVTIGKKSKRRWEKLTTGGEYASLKAGAQQLTVSQGHSSKSKDSRTPSSVKILSEYNKTGKLTRVVTASPRRTERTSNRHSSDKKKKDSIDISSKPQLVTSEPPMSNLQNMPIKVQPGISKTTGATSVGAFRGIKKERPVTEPKVSKARQMSSGARPRDEKSPQSSRRPVSTSAKHLDKFQPGTPRKAAAGAHLTKGIESSTEYSRNKTGPEKDFGILAKAFDVLYDKGLEKRIETYKKGNLETKINFQRELIRSLTEKLREEQERRFACEKHFERVLYVDGKKIIDLERKLERKKGHS